MPARIANRRMVSGRCARLTPALLLLAAAATDARQLVTLSEFAKVALLTPTTTRAAALSVACPLVCSAVGVVGNDFDPALLSLIIAVPSSISINAAYQRRERALTCLARYRTSSYSLHHSVQRWGQESDRSRIQRENAGLFEALLTLTLTLTLALTLSLTLTLTLTLTRTRTRTLTLTLTLIPGSSRRCASASRRAATLSCSATCSGAGH